MERIKLPVSMSKHLDVVDADGYIILQTLSYSPTDVAKIAAEAVHVLNSHDALVAERDAAMAACKVAQVALANVVRLYDTILQDGEMDSEIGEALAAISAALALAEVTE